MYIPVRDFDFIALAFHLRTEMNNFHDPINKLLRKRLTLFVKRESIVLVLQSLLYKNIYLAEYITKTAEIHGHHLLNFV